MFLPPLEALLAEGGGLDGLAEAFVRAASPTALGPRLCEALGAIIVDPAYRDAAFSHGEWVVERSERMVLRVRRGPPGGRAAALRVEPGDRLLAPLDGPLAVRRYQLHPRPAVDVLDRAAVLRPEGEQVLLPGDALLVPALVGAVEVLESEEQPVYAELSGPPLGSVAFGFDRHGVALEAISVDAEAMHLGDLLSALSAVEHPGLAARLPRLARHRSHDLRWRTIQVAGAMSLEEALPLLRAAVDDAHPHVAARARTVLASLDSARASGAQDQGR